MRCEDREEEEEGGEEGAEYCCNERVMHRGKEIESEIVCE